MRRWPTLLVIVPAFGCAPDFPSGSPDDGGGRDNNMTPDAQLCFGSFVNVCFDSMADVPQTARTLSGEIDTDNSPLCDLTASVDGSKTTYCVVTGMGLMVASATTVRGVGNRPLVLLSTTSFDLLGDIDVSSTKTALTQSNGAGANPATACPDGTPASGNSGGYGGSFSGRGGDGEGKNGAQGQPPAAAGAFPPTPRGGGPRGNGGTAGPPPHGGRGGGRGGGAAG